MGRSRQTGCHRIALAQRERAVGGSKECSDCIFVLWVSYSKCEALDVFWQVQCPGEGSSLSVCDNLLLVQEN